MSTIPTGLRQLSASEKDFLDARVDQDFLQEKKRNATHEDRLATAARWLELATEGLLDDDTKKLYRCAKLSALMAEHACQPSIGDRKFSETAVAIVISSKALFIFASR